MVEVIEIDGERAVVVHDAETGMFRGEFLGLTGGADFYAGSLPGLVVEGAKSLEAYIDLCREKGLEPRSA